MENFKEILNELITQKGLSIIELSKITNINRRQFYFYLGGTYPNLTNAIKICNALDCSLDYLFNISNDKNYTRYLNKNGDIKKFMPRYLQLLNDNQTSHFVLSRQHKFSTSIFQDWKKGASPSLKILEIIAYELGSSIDYLVGRI